MLGAVKILGLINLLLIIFQLLSGMRIIRISSAIHRKTGLLLLLTAVSHAVIAGSLH